MNNEWHPCRYIDCTLEHDGSWVDGKCGMNGKIFTATVKSLE